jgi:hypothetical protein
LLLDLCGPESDRLLALRPQHPQELESLQAGVLWGLADKLHVHMRAPLGNVHETRHLAHLWGVLRGLEYVDVSNGYFKSGVERRKKTIFLLEVNLVRLFRIMSIEPNIFKRYTMQLY